MRILAAHKALGVIFLCLLLLGVWLTYAIFSKKFADYDEVSLQTSKIGLQLPQRADVKVRGVIVGEVLEFESDAEGAVLTLGLYPGEIDTIPADVTGSIVPKTLFGEKYVSLEIPEGSQTGDAPLEVGQTIERTDVSIEVEKVLSDLYPLLRTVQPAELNMTLNAIATALEGRGERLGENLETLDAYLKRLNPQVPQIIDDLRLTAQVSDTYADVMPQIARILRNTITTTGTLEDRDAKVRALYTDVAAFASTSRDFLDTNGDNLIRLGDVSAQQLRLLARYAPEYPCLLEGIVNAGVRQAEAFRGFTLHIVLETLPNQPRGYNASDTPRFGDTRGPTCLHLPNPPFDQENPVRTQPDFDDGVDEPTGKGTSRVAPSWGSGAGFEGSTAEEQMLKSLLAPGLGVTADDVPDLGVLLVGPMARGAEVSLR
ncbi:MCE family protein [Nocardioides euryhalodurans]|uniref:MCE family protein n=1 Tax=Nocardioides euryhalodurans TaxID=2518370 RepID=A0A4P7GKV3_9ACTN|nr:MCE family protein [Nocardioides euryhalodurans]QBR92429.1 MCE family protein [Nocardioides euryhalodurans]